MSNSSRYISLMESHIDPKTLAAIAGIGVIGAGQGESSGSGAGGFGATASDQTAAVQSGNASHQDTHAAGDLSLTDRQQGESSADPKKRKRTRRGRAKGKGKAKATMSDADHESGSEEMDLDEEVHTESRANSSSAPADQSSTVDAATVPLPDESLDECLDESEEVLQPASNGGDVQMDNSPLPPNLELGGPSSVPGNPTEVYPEDNIIGKDNDDAVK
jgi:hypothetical protein